MVSTNTGKIYWNPVTTKIASNLGCNSCTMNFYKRCAAYQPLLLDSSFSNRKAIYFGFQPPVYLNQGPPPYSCYALLRPPFVTVRVASPSKMATHPEFCPLIENDEMTLRAR